jgi:protein SCO1/2/putative membrane protein
MFRLKSLPVIFIAAACFGCRAPVEVVGEIGDFSLVNQEGQTITRSDLLGKVWVASFIFTRCSTGCPQVISESLTKLQKATADKPDVVLVSFTVDPNHDGPEVLREFAHAHGADPQRWWLLTGDRDRRYQLIQNDFLLAVSENEGPARTPGNEVLHSTRLVLVDRQARVRGYFEGRQVNERGEAIHELPKLKRALASVWSEGRWITTEDLPAVNATLNAISGALIVLGYLAVRNRKIALHKACMLTAVGVSAMFLTSYLYYHFVVRRGEPTSFTGTGWIRSTYFAILLSHTVLAAMVAPMALITAYLGLRNRIDKHVRIARWTLPIWVYVSVTGVLVYWMLYRHFPPN